MKNETDTDRGDRGVWRAALLSLGRLSAVLLALSFGPQLTRLKAQNCANPPNAIVAENCLPGNPASEWDVGINGDDPSIVGFASDMSVNQGQTINFKIRTDATAYTMDIYRLGYYHGMGARKVASIQPSVQLPQSQPPCIQDGATNLVDCGNWAVTASWQVPANATSGIYFVHLVRSDTQGDNHIVFIVRSDSSHSDLLFQTSDETWQAYNDWGPGPGGGGGHSLYGPTGQFDINNRAHKVSYNRPFHTRDFEDESLSFVFGPEYAMVRWLEANGYDVSYFTGVDAARYGSLILNHKVYLSVGHDEYWSGPQRANIQAARDAGVNLAFFSGNEGFWKTRWENSIDGSNTPYRTLVCYKETYANQVIDPADPPTWTGTWRDPRFSPPGDGGHPENALNGTIFMVNGPGSDNINLSIQVPAADGKMRFWRNTSIANLTTGQTATLPAGTLGYEWDEDLDNGFRPAGTFDLSTATYNLTSDLLLDYGETYGAGTATHHMTMYRAPSGALVFGAGTVQWSFALDGTHDNPLGASTTPDVRMQQATVNLFADMGAQPGSLQPGLVAASPSTDTTPPVSTITYPAPGTNIQTNQITITGTAADSGGGVVGGVEVSVDSGNTWHPATGRESWSYVWQPTQNGSATIMSRAVDDSGNLETPSSGVTVNVTGAACGTGNSIWSCSTVPGITDAGGDSSVELGVKFRSDVAGFVTGVRYYKSANNTGIHVGNLWSATGTLLASVQFSGETSSGWQQANFSNPVPIAANTTYVISYHSNFGHYADDQNYFSTTGVDNPPLHALANGVDGPNGVFAYGSSSTFPSSGYYASNYWVDVVFSPSGTGSGPIVTSVSPANGAVNVTTTATVTATFNEAMDPTTINTNTFQLLAVGCTEGSCVVPAAVAYNSSTFTATLTPTQALSNSTTYTANVLGGANGVKDTNGNALSSNYTWSFTTVGAPGQCPCSIWTSGTPSTPDAGPDQPVELGLKFTSDQNGYITGIRFYKSAANTGTHTGSLWTSSGTLLATAIFTNETASGWQQVSFSSPVAITANTVYVASYHTSVGHYADDQGYFATRGFDNPPLHALADGASGPNGVYSYSADNPFPASGFNASNYWVDVVFASSAVTVSPASLSFGSQQVNTTSAPQTVTLTNNSSSTLTISSVSTSGDFAQTNTCGTSLPAGSNCTISVTFTPTGTGTRTGTLTISDSDPSSPRTVSLSGVGTNATTVNLLPSSLSFGNQLVNTTSGAQAVTLTNTGASPLTITSIGITGANSGDFAQTNTCPLSPSTLAPNASCTINVTFTPTATGTRTASLSVSDDGVGSPQTASLSGTGTAPAASLSPTSLSFGNQPVNTTSAPQAVTLTNTGSATLNIASISITGTNSTDFAQINNCPASLGVGANCSINVTFTPTATGTRTASLSVSDDATGSPQTVSLTGTGISTPAVSLSPASLNFGNQPVNTTSPPQTVTLTNTGSGTLTISSIGITGTNSGAFAQTNNCPASLGAGANCTISVTFTPTSAGAKTASLSISDNAAGSPQKVGLSGTGTTPAVSLSPTSLAFGNQLVSTSSPPQAVTLTNTGLAPLTLTRIAMGGMNPASFAQTNNCPASLPAGANCTINVTFTPKTVGVKSASLNISDNAPGSPQKVSLSGTGIQPAVSLSPASLFFGSVNVNTASAPQVVILTNTGTADLTISTITLIGNNPGDFTQSNNCATSVAPAAQCLITVTFTPTRTGIRTASVAVYDNAPNSPQRVGLSGIGQ